MPDIPPTPETIRLALLDAVARLERDARRDVADLWADPNRVNTSLQPPATALADAVGNLRRVLEHPDQTPGPEPR